LLFMRWIEVVCCILEDTGSCFEEAFVLISTALLIYMLTY
jgi:hypothetical protein